MSSATVTRTAPASGAMLWTGRILTTLVALFLLSYALKVWLLGREGQYGAGQQYGKRQQ